MMIASPQIPGRYARWSLGFTAPAVQIVGRGYDFDIRALNDRGVVLCAIIKEHLAAQKELFELSEDASSDVKGRVLTVDKYFQEEDRSKQPSLFSLVRSIKDIFATPETSQLGRTAL
jgi:anthranilate synthase